MVIIIKRVVKVGDLAFGGGEIFIQSMLNLPPDDIAGNIAQAERLVKAGCDVIRVAVPEKGNAGLIAELKQAVRVPVVADIHFDYRIAIASVHAGADKIRINPGNIGDADRVKAVVNACRNAGIPIRVGVNSGSTNVSIVRAAIENIRLLERFDFNDIVVSVKSSSVAATIAAYRQLSEAVPYPLHLGVTEAGTARMGLVKSAIGIGSLLCDGIGDTIRVSLTADPESEVEAAIDILKAVGLRKRVEVISCPTCGRCKIDVISLAGQVESLTRDLNKPLKIGVMGCAVNGPGECKEADFGITGGDGEGLIFKHGEIVRKVAESELVNELMNEINQNLLNICQKQ
ncbi:MAG: flavodoxin-dependent (E)-4-hydroxy-3-methylbut-2-enyl-diphosphate synthase [Oscillospiraceae bacterium]|nr:flavodoxin-dependent (E)-4-hydroxy-3-methylbut-2-enyl-diphosphate synthase [Oscillospiraceae bacterium]